AEAVAEMRRKSRPEFEMADLFMDFKSIHVTLEVTARAVIDGRIDCKTAGRLLVQLQMASKLLWMVHRKGREGRKENQISPLICADKRGPSKVGNLPEQRTEVPTTKSTCSIVRSQAKGRSEQALDQEKALELRTKVVATSTGNVESLKTTRAVVIGSPERAVSGSCTFWQRAARPILLTA
ncbi:MAG TPA: hypothetical protein VFP11_03585, partial [Candidatus Angelobacter sp.]|nr:hypothetical protein [Candidatus Angelobacter sp.]